MASKRGMLFLVDGEPSPDDTLHMVKALKHQFKELIPRKRNQAIDRNVLLSASSQERTGIDICVKRRRREPIYDPCVSQIGDMNSAAGDAVQKPSGVHATPKVKSRKSKRSFKKGPRPGHVKSDNEVENNSKRTVNRESDCDASQCSKTKPISKPLPQKLQACSSYKRAETELGFVMPKKELYVALDCEFVGVGPNGCRSALARCSIVDFYGVALCDIFTRPEEHITDYRTRWSGIRPDNLKNAIPVKAARRIIKKILKDKIIIGHSVHHDFEVLGIFPPPHLVRDTSHYNRLHLMAADDINNPPRSLKKLSAALLGRTIQNGPHSSVQDAVATLDLFKLVRVEWETSLAAICALQKPKTAVRTDRQRTISETSIENVFFKDDYWPADV